MKDKTCWDSARGVEDEPRLFCAFEQGLSTINFSGFAKVLRALLEFYVGRDRRGDQFLLIVHDFDGKHE